MDKRIYINRIASYLPNAPINNEEMEDYIGLIGGKPSRVRSIVLRQNGIKVRYYGLDKERKLTHSNAQLAKEAITGLFDNKIVPTDVNPHSPCRNCSDFSVCFQASNRCYANIMKAYGVTNFDYPDPRCIHTPNFTYSITHEHE